MGAWNDRRNEMEATPKDETRRDGQFSEGVLIGVYMMGWCPDFQNEVCQLARIGKELGVRVIITI